MIIRTNTVEALELAKTAAGPFSVVDGAFRSTVVKICGDPVVAAADLVDVTPWGHLLVTSCPENW